MRIAKAKEEMSLAEEFDMVIVNHQLDKAKEESVKLVSSFLKG